MQRTPPRHLAPPERARPQARDHLLVESILALVAIGLTTAIVIASLLDRPESSAARLPHLLPGPTTTRAAPTVATPASRPPAPEKGNLLADPGFEVGLTGWRSLGGAGLERVGRARQGSWAVRLTRGSARWPGMLRDDVARLRASKRFAATAWVRASRDGTLVQVNLFEVLGGKRYAVDTVGAVAGAGEWQRIEVSHDAHRPGATLAVEIIAPELTSGSSLLVDDLAINATSASMTTH
jgi:carbohydrate binding protein with CBM4/9 domain